MALPLANTFEGGTNGSAITVANSGGASGDAFDVITSGASVTKTYDNSQQAVSGGHGLAMKIVQPATGAVDTAAWTTKYGTQTGTVWFRFYVLWPVDPATTERRFRLMNGAAFCCYVYFSTATRTFRFGDSAAVALTGGVAVAAGGWNRIEGKITHTAGATGAGEIRNYAGDSATVILAVTTATGNYLAQSTEAQIGSCLTPAASVTAYFDSVAVNNTGWIGPDTGAAGVARRASILYANQAVNRSSVF